MVKPAMTYLDVLARVADRSSVPVWAYQVSGEYAMVEAAAANGWIDRRAALTDSVLGIRRAGAAAEGERGVPFSLYEGGSGGVWCGAGEGGGPAK